MVLQWGWAFRMWMQLVPLEKRPHGAPLLFLPGRTQWEVSSLQPERGALPEPDHTGTQILNLRPPYLWERNFCCLQVTQSLVFVTAAWTGWDNYYRQLRLNPARHSLKNCVEYTLELSLQKGGRANSSPTGSGSPSEVLNSPYFWNVPACGWASSEAYLKTAETCHGMHLLQDPGNSAWDSTPAVLRGRHSPSGESTASGSGANPAPGPHSHQIMELSWLLYIYQSPITHFIWRKGFAAEIIWMTLLFTVWLQFSTSENIQCASLHNICMNVYPQLSSLCLKF